MNLIWKSILYSTIAANFTIFFFGNYNIIASLINFIDDINLYNMIFFFATLMVCMVLNIISIFKLLANQYISKLLMFFLNVNNLLNICLIFIGLLVLMFSSGGGGIYCLLCFGVNTVALILGTIIYVFSFINIWSIHNLIKKSLNKLNLFKNKENVKVKMGDIDMNFIFNRFIFNGFTITCLIISLIIFFLAQYSGLGYEIYSLFEIISFIYIALFSLMFSLYNFLHILRNFYLIFTVKTQN